MRNKKSEKLLFIPSWYPVFGSKGGLYFISLLKLYKSFYPKAVLFYIELETYHSTRQNLIRYILKSKYFRYFYFRVQIQMQKAAIGVDGDLILRLKTPFSPDDQNNYYNHLFQAYKLLYQQKFSDYKFISAQSMEYAGLIAYHLSKKFPDLEYTVTEHNYFSSGRFTKQLWMGVRSSFENAKNVFFCSLDKQKQVLSTGILIDASKCRVNYNYVEDSSFVVKKYKPRTRLKIISVASASHFKDLVTLFGVINKLTTSNVVFDFTLVGYDSWGDSNKYLPTGLVNTSVSNIELIPFLDHENLLKRFCDNHLFLLTSIAEGMPVSLLEALGVGLIGIVTKHGGSEEVIIDGLHGFVHNIRDVEGICYSIEKIFKGDFHHVPELIKRRTQRFSSASSYSRRTFFI